MRMIRRGHAGVLPAMLALCAPVVAMGQEAGADSVFRTGGCPTHVADAVKWDDVATEVDVPARIRIATIPRFPMHLRDDGGEYHGRVVLAMVVDTAGTVVPGTVTIDESTDLKSAWGCLIVFQLRFVPAMKGGKAVHALAEQAFSYNMERRIPMMPPPLPRSRWP